MFIIMILYTLNVPNSSSRTRLIFIKILVHYQDNYSDFYKISQDFFAHKIVAKHQKIQAG